MVDSALIYDSDQHGSRALEELVQAARFRGLIVQLARRDVVTRYKRSILGIAWTMLNPLGTMLVIAIVFSQLFHGVSAYPVYVLSGLIAWTFFAQTTTATISHMVWGSALLKRVFIPRSAFAISSVGTGLVNITLSLVPLLVILMITGVPIRYSILFLPVPVLLLAMFALGIGLLLSALAVFYTDVAEIYQIVLLAWFYLTPVIYPADIIPESFRVWYLMLNPMSHLVKLFRRPLYYGELPSLLEIAVAAGIATLTLAIGWVFFARRADEIAYRV